MGETLREPLRFLFGLLKVLDLLMVFVDCHVEALEFHLKLQLPCFRCVVSLLHCLKLILLNQIFLGLQSCLCCLLRGLLFGLSDLKLLFVHSLCHVGQLLDKALVLKLELPVFFL